MEEVDEITVCSACQSELDDDNKMMLHNGDEACSDCVRSCERCGDCDLDDANWSWVDDSEYWCESCAEGYANWCDRCEMMTSDDFYRIEDRCESWCQGCTENYASWCEWCDQYYRDGCENCDDEYANGTIHDYSYKPDPIFHSTKDDDKLFFGIEVEMETADESSSTRSDAAQYAYTLDDNDLAYLKSDGSLTCGFEVVTHPMTHDFYKNEADLLWQTIEGLRSRSMRSHDTRTCGIHIHISRSGFSSGAHMHRFLNLVYSNEEFFSKMAGRKSDRWATFDDVKTSKMNESETGWVSYNSFKHKIQSGRNTNRYSAINTQNRHTLEMRIFKGNLNTETIKSHLDLAHASVEYTRIMSVSQVREGSLSKESFLEYISANSELYPHLNARIAKVYTPATI